MSIELAREHLKKFNFENKIIEFVENTATVELAAKAVGCEPKQIAKTKSFVTKKVIKVTAIETTTNGTMDSKSKIPVNCFPYFFITEVFNSAPIKNPIKERASEFIGSSAVITCELKI